jgi:protein-S-isoprenylcysteine O-methyltransferase Ste14
VTEPRGRGPDVRIPPPFFFVAGFLVGWLIDAKFLHLWPALGPTVRTVLDWLGGVLFGAGIGLSVSGFLTFRRAGTAIIPNHDASRLVRAGPYRFTRNPMYLGLSLAYVGLSIFMAVGWPLLILPIVIMVLQRLVIDREERYLTQAFGDDYRAYQREVGRWW